VRCGPQWPRPRIRAFDWPTDAKFYPLIWGHSGILVRHPVLGLNGTAHRVNGTGKLDQHAVASSLDDATTVGGNGGIDKASSERFQPG
jgi:hypothetical protein